jgi:predicted DNA-binding transcriptional regulator YafY
MLQDMGIPVETERGPYGAYQLQRGYKLPPLMFTEAEAVSLTLGLLAIREFRFPVNVAAIEGALAKTERVMPAKLLNQARALQEAITFSILPPPVQLQNDFVVTLSSAVQQRRQVFLRYLSWHGEESERDFDPYGILFHEGYWYTSGYCHLRQDMRTFRLDRILALEPGEQSFERPDDFDMLGYVLASVASMPGTYQVEAMLKTSFEHAQQVICAALGTLELSEKGVIFRRAVHQLEWIAHFLLGLDFPVVIIQPAELRDTLRQMAAKALQMVGDKA